jgi:aspartate/glutamate racemase
MLAPARMNCCSSVPIWIFARLIDRLTRGGATFAVISAGTPHACIRELEKITPLPLVNITRSASCADATLIDASIGP